MSTITITDAQDGVTCPSCGVKESDSWEWVGTEWEFNCGACGAAHEVVDRHATMTIWLTKERKDLRVEDREDPRVDTAKAERHPVEDEIDEPWRTD